MENKKKESYEEELTINVERGNDIQKKFELERPLELIYHL